MSFLPINLIVVLTLVAVIAVWGYRSKLEGSSLNDNLLGYGVLALAVGATINSFFTNWGLLFVVIAVITALACLALYKRSVSWVALMLVLFFGMVIGAWLRDVSLWLAVVINVVIAGLIYFGTIEKVKLPAWSNK